jgi:mycothiol synthase
MRPFEESDLEAVLALLAADEEQLLGRPSRIGMSDLRQWLALSDLATETWLEDDDAGLVAVGWAGVWGETATAIGVVHPRAKGLGLGAQLVERSESWASEHGAPRLHQLGLGGDSEAASLFCARGYREVRRFYEMAIELDAPPSPPREIVVEPFREEAARAFHAALDEAFQDHWEHRSRSFDEWWALHRKSATFDPSLWFMVRDGDEVAAAVRNEPDRNGGGYVGALGVRRPWRGRGYGRALLLHTFAAFHERGTPRVTLGVDAQSPTGATKLYESVGMEVEQENVVYEKELA